MRWLEKCLEALPDLAIGVGLFALAALVVPLGETAIVRVADELESRWQA